MTPGGELQKGVRFCYGGAACQLQGGERFWLQGETVVALRGGLQKSLEGRAFVWLILGGCRLHRGAFDSILSGRGYWLQSEEAWLFFKGS